MQNDPNDEFSFKGVAPSDRAEHRAPTNPEEPPAPLPAPAVPRVPLSRVLAAAQPEKAAAPISNIPNTVPPGYAAAGPPAAPAAPPGAALASPAPLAPAPAAPSASMEPEAAVESTPPAVTPEAVAPPQPEAAPAAPTPVAAPESAAGDRPKVHIEVADPGAPAKHVNPRHLVQGWLQTMVDRQASDLILRSGGRPSQRLDGRISFLPGQVPGPGPMLEVLSGILGEKRMATFEETGAADAALDLDGLGRFRINAYKQMGEPAIVIRRINEDAPSLDDLHLPAGELKDLALRKRGLVLVTGVAGSGKSTTLSAMIEFMNRNVERHVVTLEDPVELLFKERYCVISQREVGTDTQSFKLGLKHALRQSPDVILIGEMRDAETVLAALEAIETGHLVMSTMHTVNASQTVDRILGFFPAERHVQIRQRMADTLAGVLSMRLVPRIGGGQVPAYELMQVTPQVRELLEEGKTTELGRVIQGGMEKGIVAFNDRLMDLVQTGMIEMDDALGASDRPDELIMMIRGIQGGVRASAKAAAASGNPSGAKPVDGPAAPGGAAAKNGKGGTAQARRLSDPGGGAEGASLRRRKDDPPGASGPGLRLRNRDY